MSLDFIKIPIDSMRIIFMYYLTPFNTMLFLNKNLGYEDSRGRHSYAWVIKKLFGAPGINFNYTIAHGMFVDDTIYYVDSVTMYFHGGFVKYRYTTVEICLTGINLYSYDVRYGGMSRWLGDGGMSQIDFHRLRQNVFVTYRGSQRDVRCKIDAGMAINEVIKYYTDMKQQSFDEIHHHEAVFYDIQFTHLLKNITLIKKYCEGPAFDHQNIDIYDRIFRHLLCWPEHLLIDYDVALFFEMCETQAWIKNMYGRDVYVILQDIPDQRSRGAW